MLLVVRDQPLLSLDTVVTEMVAELIPQLCQ
jgi:hypothetical protein